jgi:hypothetical protein
MADFFRYLLHCARSYIQETYTRGTALWIALEDGIEFIISHPNGWEGAQQASLRKAAIIAGLIPNSSAGHKRIHFVTEGEASLHFCIKNGLATDSLRASTCFFCDARSRSRIITARTRCCRRRRGWWNGRYQHIPKG